MFLYATIISVFIRAGLKCAGHSKKWGRDKLHCLVSLPPKWLDSRELDQALRACGSPHDSKFRQVLINFPAGCKVMADAGVRLLSIANQLNFTTRRVKLNFEEGQFGTMGYLDRMGFFDHLSKEVEVFPQRPLVSGASTFRGTNNYLVEIAPINPKMRDPEIHNRLSKAVANALYNRTDVDSLEGAIWTVFAELIDNIFSHSSTLLDGYAAMQLYRNGNNLQVVVCDSGTGILETLRPAIALQFPALAALSDIDLLVEVFRQGISRHGANRGCGLKGSAQKAMKYNAELEIRLPQCRVVLVPANGSYRKNTAYCYQNLPLIWGTHISFKFHLDGGH